ncbi:hypothetical protein J6590_070800 [Homalodisca vitripennis]|nr:hypothetical protein J6590_070800 [Homalodisca vitripennis]
MPSRTVAPPADCCGRHRYRMSVKSKVIRDTAQVLSNNQSGRKSRTGSHWVVRESQKRYMTTSSVYGTDGALTQEKTSYGGSRSCRHSRDSLSEPAHPTTATHYSPCPITQCTHNLADMTWTRYTPLLNDSVYPKCWTKTHCRRFRIYRTDRPITQDKTSYGGSRSCRHSRDSLSEPAHPTTATHYSPCPITQSC